MIHVSLTLFNYNYIFTEIRVIWSGNKLADKSAGVYNLIEMEEQS